MWYILNMIKFLPLIALLFIPNFVLAQTPTNTLALGEIKITTIPEVTKPNEEVRVVLKSGVESVGEFTSLRWFVDGIEFPAIGKHFIELRGGQVGDKNNCHCGRDSSWKRNSDSKNNYPYAD